LLEVLTPLFCEMEEMGQTLDEEEFIDAAGRLYESVSLPEKNALLMIGKQSKNQHVSELLFKVRRFHVYLYSLN